MERNGPSDYYWRNQWCSSKVWLENQVQKGPKTCPVEYRDKQMKTRERF